MKEGWTYKKLGDIAEIIHGKNQKDVISEDGQYPIYGSGGNVMGYATDYLCEANTTILGRKGSINSPQFITERFWNVDTAFGIFAKNGNDSKFIYYFIKSIDWSKKNTGTTLPSLTQQVVKSVELSVPPLAEQERIVERLDSAFAQIDELKSNAERQLAEARALFQSALTQAMQPKPGWHEKTLGEIANIIHGKNQKEVVSETGKYPIYGSGGNIMGYATDYLCEAGTTILGRKGSINNPQFINERFWNVDTAFGISAKEDNDNKFIYYFIKSVDWSKKNTGTTLPSLTQSVVKSVNLFVPNLTDQQTISSYLDSLHAQILEIDRVNKRTAAECDALKQALLRQIFE